MNEREMHQELINAVMAIYAKTGVRITRADFDWMDIAMHSDEKSAYLRSVNIDTTYSPHVVVGRKDL